MDHVIQHTLSFGKRAYEGRPGPPNNPDLSEALKGRPGPPNNPDLSEALKGLAILKNLEVDFEIWIDNHLAKGSKRVLKEPWIELDHYYDKIGECKIFKGAEMERHNYFIKVRTKNNIILRCRHCDAEVSNELSKFDRVLKVLEQQKLIDEDRNKQLGDITLYRVYWRKNEFGEWLPFPGLNYPGLSKKTGEQRLYSANGHIYQAYREVRTDFEELIQQYGVLAGITDYNDPKFKDMFKIQILEIVKFQGDQKTTENIASEKEKFWIGFYHAQYREFGQNKAPGPVGAYKSLPVISKQKMDAAFEKIKYLTIHQSPFKIFIELIGLKASQEDSIYKILKDTYLHNQRPLMTEIKIRQNELIKDLVEEGYRPGEIAKIFNRLEEQELWSKHPEIGQYRKASINSETISDRIKDIYKDKYPNMEAKHICIEVIKNRIESLVNQGYTSYSDLIVFFPRYQDPNNPQSYSSLQSFIGKHITGGILGLKNKYWVKPTKIPNFDSWIINYFPKAVELIRYYEKNSIDYTIAGLVEQLELGISYHSKLFKQRFGMTFSQFRQFALTGVLPTELEHRRSEFENYI